MWNRSIQEEYDNMRQNQKVTASVPGGAYQVETQRFSIIEDNYNYLISKGYDPIEVYDEAVERALKAITNKKYFNRSLYWIELKEIRVKGKNNE